MTTVLRRLILVIGLFLAVAPAQAAQTLILGHNSPPGGPHSIGTRAFMETLQKRVPGRFLIDEKGGVTLGAEPDLWDAVRLGTIDIALITNISLSNDVPMLGVFDIPLLFRDARHARAVVDGPVGAALAERVAGSGVVVLAWGELGFRHITTSHTPMVRPEDLAGQRIRIVPNPIYRQTFRQLGAIPVEMYLPRLYKALRQELVDGEENPLLVFQANHLDDVQHYVSLTGLFYNPLLFVINTETFRSLSPDEQQALRDAAQAGAEAMRQNNDVNEAIAIQAFRAKGLIVNETIDRAAFQRALAPLRPEFDAKFGADFLRQIENTR